jgi:hypothetical protein
MLIPVRAQIGEDLVIANGTDLAPRMALRSVAPKSGPPRFVSATDLGFVRSVRHFPACSLFDRELLLGEFCKGGSRARSEGGNHKGRALRNRTCNRNPCIRKLSK